MSVILQQRIEASIRATLEDINTSDWLKDALRACLQRDSLDASIDAERLARLLAARHHAIRMQS